MFPNSDHTTLAQKKLWTAPVITDAQAPLHIKDAEGIKTMTGTEHVSPGLTQFGPAS